MARRCCCSCRKKGDSSQLIRLYVDQDNHLRVSHLKPPKGRSAWLCYQHSCLLRLKKKPKLLRGSLRTNPQISSIETDLKEHLRKETQILLMKIYRSGRLFHMEKNPKKNAQYWISYQSALAKEPKMEYLRWEKVLRFQVILGENPPSHLLSTIGIRNGKFSEQLLQRLLLLQILEQDKRMQ